MTRVQITIYYGISGNINYIAYSDGSTFEEVKNAFWNEFNQPSRFFNISGGSELRKTFTSVDKASVNAVTIEQM